MKKHLLHLYSRLILFAVLLFAFAYSTAIAQSLQTNLPITNNEVNAVLFDAANDLIYLGGSFTYVGPNTGYGVALDNSTGNVVLGFPYVNGDIYAVASDGSGGWYIGGNFTSVGGVLRNYLAHINADKSVDNSWNPNANNSVRALVLSPNGSTVYAGGYFTTLQGGAVTRNRIAAINVSDGTATSWDPNANSSVWALAVSPDGLTVYAGGQFTSIHGSARNYIAAIDASSAPTSWIPQANYFVLALAVSGDGSTVYVGGYFSVSRSSPSIGNADRNRIAAISASTGIATDWDPNANGNVNTLIVSGSTVYVGGSFSTIGGQPRNRIAAIAANTNTNNATDWNPYANSDINALAISGTTVYVGGNFTTIGGQARNYIAALDATTNTDNANDWNPYASSSVNALAIYSSTVYAGGSFMSVGGQTRNKIAAINASTGSVTNWNPNANNPVNALAISGSTVYAGGDFTSIGGLTRNYIAAIDASTGTATSWNPNANSSVLALAVSSSGNTVYAGGDFNVIWLGYSSPSIGGANRNFIAAIDATTGNATGWDPNANNDVYTLAISPDGSKVYVGGDFNDESTPGTLTIGGADRNYIAAIDANTNNATGWDPNANSTVYTLAVSGSTVYVGGDFCDTDYWGSSNVSIGGADRNFIAAIDATTGNATGWGPNANNDVRVLAISGSTVYVGGNFTTLAGGTVTRNYLAAIDADGNATSWNPNANGQVKAIAISVTNHKVYVGGQFSSIVGTNYSHFAGMDNPDDSALPVELNSFTANTVDGKVLLNWETATEVNNYGFNVERRTQSAD